MTLDNIVRLFNARREWKEKLEERKEKTMNEFHKEVARTVITNMTLEQFEKYLEDCHSMQELNAIQEEIKKRKLGI